MVSSSSSSYTSTDSYLKNEDQEEDVINDIPDIRELPEREPRKPAWGMIIGGVCFVAAIIILRKPIIRLFKSFGWLDFFFFLILLWYKII